MPRGLKLTLMISLAAHAAVMAGIPMGGVRTTFLSVPVTVVFQPAAVPSVAGAVPSEEVSHEPAPRPDPVQKKIIPLKANKARVVRSRASAPARRPAEVNTPPDTVSQPQGASAPAKEPAEAAASEPAGEAAALRPAPGGGGQVSFDTDRFPYAYYTALIVRRIGRFWRWSSEFGRLKAVIRFQIGRSGEVSSVAVESSSGDSVYDQQAVRAVRLAQPFPPLPAGYAEPALGVFFTFAFTE